MKATKYVKIDGKFEMHRGGYLESPSIAYETWGKQNSDSNSPIYNKIDEAQIGIMGHSLSGGASLRAAEELSGDIKAVIP